MAPMEEWRVGVGVHECWRHRREKKKKKKQLAKKSIKWSCSPLHQQGAQRTGDEATGVGHGKLERRGGGALVVAGRVVGVPHQHARDAAVHADGHEAGRGEAGARGGHVGDDGVARDGDGQGAEHDDAAEPEAVREEGDEDWRGN